MRRPARHSAAERPIFSAHDPATGLPAPLVQEDRLWVRDGKRRLLYFGGCDYFRLASHPKVLAAARKSLDRDGLNVAASRLTTGNHPLHEQLELDLAAFFGAEAALLVPNGYLTNLVAAQGLRGEISHAFIDAKAHASLWDAAQLLGCSVLAFDHRDHDALRFLLRKARPAKPALLTDGVFPHSGALAPLRAYDRVLPAGALLWVDDAHGGGVVGKRGRGTLDLEGVDSRPHIQTVTLSKAFGVHGGAILLEHKLRRRIVTQSRAFAGSTPIPLPIAAAARAAIRLISTNGALRQRLSRKVAEFKDRLRGAGFRTVPGPSPIVSFQPRRVKDAELVRARLIDAGIFPCLIRYGSGPGEGYFRFAISSEHTGPQLRALARVLVQSRGELVEVL